MTRSTLKRKLRRITLWLTIVLLVALIAKGIEIREHLGFGKEYAEVGKAVYEFLKDMAVVIVTIAAAYLAAILQRRSKFIESLEEEWRNIVGTKSELFAYCEAENPHYRDYVQAFCRISSTIDTMRIVYRNVGETDEHVGLYPYVPLHDMRRALQTIDPSKRSDITDVERKCVRDAILQCFYALRETFLEELDLEQPARPLLVAAGLRLKRSGATKQAESMQLSEADTQTRLHRPRPDVDGLLRDAWNREHTPVGSMDAAKDNQGN